MAAPRHIITRLSESADLLGLDLVKEYVGHDDDIDAEQDKVLPVLIQAAVDQGQQITGIVWGAAQYRIDGLFGRQGVGFFLPLAPVFAVTEVVGVDAHGQGVLVQPEAYRLIPSAIDLGRPWAELHAREGWPLDAVSFSVTCTAGWTADTLPESLRTWALNRIATLHDIRDSSGGAATRRHIDGLLDRWTVRGTPDG
jgi:hypothetical protein